MVALMNMRITRLDSDLCFPLYCLDFQVYVFDGHIICLIFCQLG